ncbi:MAG: calcium/sodium antiporter [Spongiibacteraceae bacterium]|nr:calcium/sodium antiporter [Spongiibacteraceae bacterium]
MDFIWLLTGLTLLTIAGDFLVRGATTIAQTCHIPPLLIGLTIVGFGTSAPELVVGIQAAIEGTPDLAVGNVTGSNIANILLALGVPALLTQVSCQQPFVRRNTICMLAASIFIVVFAQTGEFSRDSGITLLLLFAAYMAYSIRKITTTRQVALELIEEVESISLESKSLTKAIFYTVAGIIILPLSAALTVYGATQTASAMGVSDAVIGLTVVALGTSLPELATVIAAARQKNSAMIVGNILGSNIFNSTAILGTIILTSDAPIKIDALQFDLFIMLGATVLLSLFVLMKASLHRITGTAFMAGYIAYITTTLWTA